MFTITSLLNNTRPLTTSSKLRQVSQASHSTLFARQSLPTRSFTMSAFAKLSSNIQRDAVPSAKATEELLKDFPLFPKTLDNYAHSVRGVSRVVEAKMQSEGMGATVRRSIGTQSLRNLTPFLMLDHFEVSKGAGFPDHPHRGQETITYLLKGAVDHEDFAGHKGTIRSGDLQFMTAGRGIVHAEMPAAENNGVNEGMQLWVDLPESLKDVEPRYRDLRADEIPTVTSPDGKVTVKVISGRSYGVDSIQNLAYTPVWYLDADIKPGGKYVQQVPRDWTGFAYILKGGATIGGKSTHPDEAATSDLSASETQIDEYHFALLESKGDEVIITAGSDGARLVLVAGVPLDQPIVQYGPFVVTDQTKVREALMDYQFQVNGFERARDWKSKIGAPLM